MSFELFMEDNKILKTLFEFISSIVTECNIIVKPSGLFIDALDKGKTYGFHLSLNASDINNLDCKEECKFYINIALFTKILSSSKKGGKIHLNHDSSKHYMKVIFEDVNFHQNEFHINLFIDENEEIKEPFNLNDFSSSFNIPFRYFEEIIKNGEIFSETIILSFFDDKVSMVSEGLPGEVTSIFKDGDKIIEEFRSMEEIQGTFGILPLKKLFKLGSICESLKIELSKDSPLKITLKFKESSFIEFYLASRFVDLDF